MGLFSFFNKVGIVATKASLTIKLTKILEDSNCDIAKLAFRENVFKLPLISHQDYFDYKKRYEFYNERQILIVSKTIDLIWNKFSEIYSGKFGQKPHDLTTLFIALLYLYTLAEENYAKSCVLSALQKIGEDIIKNKNLYPFTTMDIELISKHMPFYEEHRPYEYEEYYGGCEGEIIEYSRIPMEYNWKY